MFIVANVAFMTIYKLDHPFFEQFKIQKDEKWPWQEDPKAWNELIYKTMKVVLFNNFVCLPTVLYMGAVINNF